MQQIQPMLLLLIVNRLLCHSSHRRIDARLTRLKENRRCFAYELQKMIGIGVLFEYTGEDRNVRLPFFQFRNRPPRWKRRIILVAVLQHKANDNLITILLGRKIVLLLAACLVDPTCSPVIDAMSRSASTRVTVHVQATLCVVQDRSCAR